MPKLSKELVLALPKRAREPLLPVLLTIRVAGFLLAVLPLWVFATLLYERLPQESFTFAQQSLLALREPHRPLFARYLPLGVGDVSPSLTAISV